MAFVAYQDRINKWPQHSNSWVICFGNIKPALHWQNKVNRIIFMFVELLLKNNLK